MDYSRYNLAESSHVYMLHSRSVFFHHQHLNSPDITTSTFTNSPNFLGIHHYNQRPSLPHQPTLQANMYSSSINTNQPRTWLSNSRKMELRFANRNESDVLHRTLAIPPILGGSSPLYTGGITFTQFHPHTSLNFLRNIPLGYPRQLHWHEYGILIEHACSFHPVSLFYECCFCSDRSQLGEWKAHHVDERISTTNIANQKGLTGNK